MGGTKVRVLVELTLRVSGAKPRLDAREVVDTMLDNGVLQDAILAHEVDGASLMRVVASEVIVVDGGSGGES